MLKKSKFQFIAAVFALLLFASFNALAQENGGGKPMAQTSQTSCYGMKDADLAKAIRDEFAANADFKEQMRHFNVSVKNRRVTLGGWLDGKAAVEKAVAMTKAMKCVRRVTNHLETSGGGSCGQGQRPCGDTCIGRSEVCGIGGR